MAGKGCHVSTRVPGELTGSQSVLAAAMPAPGYPLPRPAAAADATHAGAERGADWHGMDPDDLPDGLVVADHTSRVVCFNAAAARLTGIAAADAVGRPLAEALPLQDLDGRWWWSLTDPYHGLTIRTGAPESRLLLPDGRDVLVATRYVRDDSAERAMRRVVVTIRDTSMRARADRRHAELIATVAHELRSPLTSVKGFTATLLAKWERFTDEQKRLMLETVDADADRVTRLIAELLDIARIDAGRLQLRYQPVDVAALVNDQMRALRAAGRDGQRFVVEVADGVPAAHADPDKLRQVVANLLENALRHGAGSVTLTVGQRYVERREDAPGGRFVEVTVDDEGPGIPDEYVGRVFTRFWRGNKRGGTGLGLYIVKGLIEAHGGEITVGRSPSGGARFRFTVPAAASD
jgi:signal transduction histidine kinase